MRKRADYAIDWIDSKSSWFVYRKGTDVYLFRDGKMKEWYKTLDRQGVNYVRDETHFGSKSAASRALNKYLRS